MLPKLYPYDKARQVIFSLSAASLVIRVAELLGVKSDKCDKPQWMNFAQRTRLKSDFSISLMTTPTKSWVPLVTDFERFDVNEDTT